MLIGMVWSSESVVFVTIANAFFPHVSGRRTTFPTARFGLAVLPNRCEQLGELSSAHAMRMFCLRASGEQLRIVQPAADVISPMAADGPQIVKVPEEGPLADRRSYLQTPEKHGLFQSLVAMIDARNEER